MGFKIKIKRPKWVPKWVPLPEGTVRGSDPSSGTMPAPTPTNPQQPLPKPEKPPIESMSESERQKHLSNWAEEQLRSRAEFYKKLPGAVGNAAAAIQTYLKRSPESTGEALGAAERRIREGKIVDAVWHVTVKPLSTEDQQNLARLTQESELIDLAARTATHQVGGPPAVAAYVAWATYYTTGDTELALRQGLIAGAESYAKDRVQSDTTLATREDTVRRAMLAGAIGGLAVAATGGDANQIAEGFFKSGGWVLLRDNYQLETRRDLPGDLKGVAFGDLPINTFWDNQSPSGSSSQVVPEASAEGATRDGAASSPSQTAGPDGLYILNNTYCVSWDMRYLYQPGTPAVVLERVVD